jgi:putative ABC transport system ATP-binding protein
MIHVRNLKKIYGEEGESLVKALNDVFFTIKDGEFIGLMGRSGSGKSTLLHHLGLLDTQTEGTIIIDGFDTTLLSEDEKTLFRLTKLGYVFQEYGLIPEFSALENVCFPALSLGNMEATSRGEELLRYVGLGDRIHYYPHELSGGQQQRVAIARALINDPAIIFADEPTANLDSLGTEMVLALFKKLHEDFGKTIVMVTHEESDRHLVDRVLFMKDGFIVSDTCKEDVATSKSKVLRS